MNEVQFLSGENIPASYLFPNLVTGWTSVVIYILYVIIGAFVLYKSTVVSLKIYKSVIMQDNNTTKFDYFFTKSLLFAIIALGTSIYHIIINMKNNYQFDIILLITGFIINYCIYEFVFFLISKEDKRYIKLEKRRKEVIQKMHKEICDSIDDYILNKNQKNEVEINSQSYDQNIWDKFYRLKPSETANFLNTLDDEKGDE